MNSTRWKLNTGTLLNLFQTAAILTGMLFGLRELGELRRSRELESTLKVVDIAQNEGRLRCGRSMPESNSDSLYGRDGRS